MRRNPSPRTPGGAIRSPWQFKERPHVVYRVFDRDDTLLYIGATSDLKARLATHRRKANWGTDIHRVTEESCWCWADAADVEAAAIKAEQPLHNVVYRGSDLVKRARPYRRSNSMTEDRKASIRAARDALTDTECYVAEAALVLREEMRLAREVDGCTQQEVGDVAGFRSVQAANYWYDARGVKVEVVDQRVAVGTLLPECQ